MAKITKKTQKALAPGELPAQKQGPRPTAGKLEPFAILILIIAFFAIALSQLNNLVKGVVLIGILVASGAVVARLARADNYYGLVMIRTTHGFNLMKFIAEKHPKLVNALSDLGLSLGLGAFYSYFLFHKDLKKVALHLILLLALFSTFSSATTLPNYVLSAVGVLFGLAGVGFVTLAMHAFNIATIPGTPAGVQFVVPGLTVPWEAIFAIAIIAIIHETAHGVMFYVEKLKVKHSGALLFGFIPVGAFVEPDEEEFKKHSLNGKRRILVAGSASNLYTALVFVPLMLLLGLALTSLTAQSGILVTGVARGSPADGILANGAIITGVNGVTVKDLGAFVNELKKVAPGGTVDLQLLDGTLKRVALNSEGKLGVNVEPYVKPSNGIAYGIVNFFSTIISWSVLLSLALAVINLLPLFVTDGHRLILEELESKFGENKAKIIANGAGIVMLLLLLVNLVPSIFK